MASFPSAATSMIQGMTAPFRAGIQSLPRPLPRFRLVPASRLTGIVIPLSTVLEDEIIPRLALAHPSAETLGSEPAGLWARPEGFARTLLDRDGDAASAVIADALEQGADPQSLYEAVLAPTAFVLAKAWRDDRLSATEVTIGLSRLQRLVRELPCETPYNGDNNEEARSALFAPRPGETQTFGFQMTGERFRWEGWRTWIETMSTCEDLVANVRDRWFDMVCLSASRTDDLTELSGVIAAIRCASRNEEVVIALEGTSFTDTPALVSVVGAQAVVSSAGSVLNVAVEEQAPVPTA